MNSENKPLNFVIDVELSLSLEELTDLKRLADKLGISTEEVARSCMMHRCKEQLKDIGALPESTL
jgi:hypothetical protein